jgi:hypothetical protein
LLVRVVRPESLCIDSRERIHCHDPMVPRQPDRVVKQIIPFTQRRRPEIYSS